MKIDPHKYTAAFEEDVKKRFKNFHSVKVRRVKEGYGSDYAVDWPYLGIDYKVNFYVNGQKRLNFFIELEFEREEGLRKKLEDAISGSKIEKLGLLNRPQREYFDSEKKEFYKHHILEKQRKGEGINKEGESDFKTYVDMLEENNLIRKGKDYYFLFCRVKRVPKNPKVLIENIFGNIIAPIYNKIMHSSN